MSDSQFNPMDLTGRRFLVTGAASGIGRATARLLAKLGAKVACLDRNEVELRSTVDSMSGNGHSTQVRDLRKIETLGEWLIELVDKFGTLHGFVHAAGSPAPTPLRALTVEAWREVFLINTEAALALAKGFQSRKVYAGENGSIVFVSSVMGQVGSAAAVAYSMSKAALDGMARSLALELAPRQIRVNCIAPSFVQTPMLDLISTLWTSEQRHALEAQHPLGMGRPEDVANAAAFLLAETGRWITGTVLVVDGGYIAH